MEANDFQEINRVKNQQDLIEWPVIWVCKGVLVVLNVTALFCVLVSFSMHLYLMGLSGYMGISEVIISLILGAVGLFLALVCMVPSWCLHRHQKDKWRISVPLYLNLGTWVFLVVFLLLVALGQ